MRPDCKKENIHSLDKVCHETILDLKKPHYVGNALFETELSMRENPVSLYRLATKLGKELRRFLTFSKCEV